MANHLAKPADGDAGARRAASLIILAVCAEITNASLVEEAAKADLKVSFRHAFDDTLVTVVCQVKSGPSYVSRRDKDRRTRTIRIDRKTKDALQDGAPPTLLAWVPLKPSPRVYWHVRDPRAPSKETVYIPDHQSVSPYLRIHLSRVASYGRHGPRHALMEVRNTPDAEILATAKSAYRDLKAKSWRHPLVGRLYVTRLAWRHVTRRSKKSALRRSTLKVTPYLKNIINKMPDRYVAEAPETRSEGRSTIETRNLLFWYRNVLKIDGQEHALMLRVKEEIRYPTEWYKYSLSVDDVIHTATLVSWWAKLNK